MPTASEQGKAHKTAEMISTELSILMRSILIFSGATGFAFGFGLALWKEIPVESALLRGTFLCIIFSMVARWLTMSLFRIHVRQIFAARKAELSKQQESAGAAP